MKTLITIILILITTLNLNAKTTNLYNHARDSRLSSLDSKNYSKKIAKAKSKRDSIYLGKIELVLTNDKYSRR